MKASELRIGNMVLINGKIVIMDTKMFHAVIHGFPGYETEPIPLTEEWLIKSGLEKIDYYYKININVMDEIRILDDMSVGTYAYGTIAHAVQPSFMKVHQLQNLYFALTGEELILIEKP